MTVQETLEYPHPIISRAHETALSIALTGMMLSKEAYQLLRKHRLTDSQFNVLMLLKYQTRDGSVSQTQLGRMLLVNRSNVTGLVDRLEENGWVERLDDPEDRRVKLIGLTAKGRRILDRAEKAYMARVEQAMGALNSTQMRTLCRLLEEVRGGLSP